MWLLAAAHEQLGIKPSKHHDKYWTKQHINIISHPTAVLQSWSATSTTIPTIFSHRSSAWEHSVTGRTGWPILDSGLRKFSPGGRVRLPPTDRNLPVISQQNYNELHALCLWSQTFGEIFSLRIEISTCCHQSLHPKFLHVQSLCLLAPWQNDPACC